ncbi:MAG: hypothetical protein M3464_00030 [Chloroflexota bacterium]|nr:hypothetical protein [Chloroflexota bacterium]
MTAPLPATKPARVPPFLDDPPAFAEYLWYRLADCGDERIGNLFDQIDPPLYALSDRLGPDATNEATMGPIHDLVTETVRQAHAAGIAFGAAAELVRQALLISIGPTSQQK